MARRTQLADLETFVEVARAGGFRRAAVARGVTGSALSHAIRGLEERLAVRLFHRSNRNVSLTAAGEALLAELAPRLRDIDEAVVGLDRFRERPVGRVRVTALRDAAQLLIAPKMPSFIEAYPDIEIEVDVDDKYVNMIDEGFDAGIRYGGTIPQDMVAARLTGELEWVVVGAPSYFASHGRPSKPQELMQHQCIRMRAGHDRIYRWELGVGHDDLALDVPGHLTLGDSVLSIDMAVAGVGLYYCLRRRVADHLAAGSLDVALADWTSPGPGFHAYYASHRHVPSALRAFLDHLKE
jgi:DNA-binding transcriptional LysR family regulator